MLLLTTIGRRNGEPLTFYDDWGTPVVVASNGGLEPLPAWLVNRQHNPAVRLKVFADEYDATRPRTQVQYLL